MAVSGTVANRIGRKQFQALYDEVWQVTATVDPASVAAEATGSDTITFSGIALGDIVLGWSLGVAITDNLVVQCFVSAADTLKLAYANNNVAAGAAIDLASSTFKAYVARPSF